VSRQEVVTVVMPASLAPSLFRLAALMASAPASWVPDVMVTAMTVPLPLPPSLLQLAAEVSWQ
jgi:hypothetical protein